MDNCSKFDYSSKMKDKTVKFQMSNGALDPETGKDGIYTNGQVQLDHVSITSLLP